MDPAEAIKTEELTAMLRAVRDRVRARHPQAGAGNLPLADLMPLAHARDAAEAKVAAIGTVNPRPAGPLNAAIQAVKNLIARALDWHVREQVEFNRQAMECVAATLEALNELNRALAEAGNRLAALDQQARELADIRDHWAEWRVEWERKLAENEMQFLRSVADLQSAFQHRVTLMEANFREMLSTQHAAFTGAIERSAGEVQQRFWADLERVRLEYERLIHSELRTVRQRAALAPAPPAVPAPPPPAPVFDYGKFAEKFRGPEEYVREAHSFYVPYFAGREAVLDIGCGRGEFLELMREAGVTARGIDLDAESVALCRAKGLDVEEVDLFAHLDALPDAALDGIFCAQVVEHLPPDRLPELIRLAAARLRRGGLLLIETPNPECLAIFATHFYLDPTHTRPVPHPLLTFYMSEYGFGLIEVHRRAPAMEGMPSLAALPGDFRTAFFGAQDYAAIGRKL